MRASTRLDAAEFLKCLGGAEQDRTSSSSNLCNCRKRRVSSGLGLKSFQSMSHEILVSFAGPFSWHGTPDATSVFDRDEARKAGIYLWTVPLLEGHLIYYVLTRGAQAACDFSFSMSKFSPFFHTVKVMAAILRASVRRTMVGLMPLASERWQNS